MHVSTTPAVELEDVSFAYRGGPPGARRTSRSPSRRGVRRRSPGRTAAARRRCCASCSGSSARASGRVRCSAARRARAAQAADRLPRRSARSSRRATPVTVRELVSAGTPRACAGPSGRCARRDRDAVAQAIERVGLGDRADAPLRTLSGGMQQRAFIAKALATEPALLALDEPTTGVDAESQESLAVLLAELRSELGVTILYVSHEFGAVEHVVSRLVLVRRRIVFDGAAVEAARPSGTTRRTSTDARARVHADRVRRRRGRRRPRARGRASSSSSAGSRSWATASGTSRSPASRPATCSTSRPS